MKIEVLKPDNLKGDIRSQIESLKKSCFSDVPEKEIKENFYAVPFATLVAMSDKTVIGTLSIFKREITFDRRNIVLGGIGAVCVLPRERRKGIGTLMVKKAMQYLKKQKCDIACLNVDTEKKVYGIYEKVGFVMMNREISFENIYGKIIKEKGTMFAPINSKELFNFAMENSKTFHYGKGYW